MKSVELSGRVRLSRIVGLIRHSKPSIQLRRKLICFALVTSLLILPGPGLPLPALASTAFDVTAGSLSYLPLVIKNLFGFLSSAKPRPQNLAERNASVLELRVSPHKLVGYVGDRVTFVGMGVDGEGQPAHGAKFEWESSDTSKLEIDEAGGATLLLPGLVRVTCRAGSASRSAPVLIRSTRRRLQTDLEWRVDQDSLSETAAGPTGFIEALPSLLEKLAPTAHAQFNPWGDNPKATWPGHVGTPPLTALEETRLGPVMPGSNFELPISLVNLGARGLATSLTAYYNSNVWGGYVSGNDTVYAFDPIQSWPSPGFSLGFGRVTFYDYSNYEGIGPGYKYMLIDANGTRHSLGIGSDTGSNTLQTTDGSHIMYAGNVLGGTLYYPDGTKMTISVVNNRRLPTQITDTNGNYIQIAYKAGADPWGNYYPAMAINYIVDTLGRVIQFNYNAYNSTNLTSISTPVGGATFNYQTVTMNHNFQNEIIIENAPASFSGVSSVTVSQQPTYSFNYSGYGMIYNISLATGGGNATVTYNYPLGGEELYGGPTFTQRTESPNAVYTYAVDGIIRPDGTKLILSGVDRELKSTTNTTLAKTVSTLTTDPGGSAAVQSVKTYDELGQQIKTDFDYDVYGNVTNKREYGYQIGGQWKVRRRTHYS